MRKRARQGKGIERRAAWKASRSQRGCITDRMEGNAEQAQNREGGNTKWIGTAGRRSGESELNSKKKLKGRTVG